MSIAKVVIVDDSIFAREVIKELVKDDKRISIVGEASNGKDALLLAQKLRPDLITMDITMPIMNGYEAIQHIMATAPTPILVLTSSQESDLAYRAIAYGALEVLEKPKLSHVAKDQFIAKLLFLSKVKVIRHVHDRITQYTPKEISEHALTQSLRWKNDYSSHIQSHSPVIAIASSTGGPKALATILSALPPLFPATILIAQHIGIGFSSGLASWLHNVSPIPVSLALHKEPINPAHVYIAPDGCHISLSKEGEILLNQNERKLLYTPSADLLLSSVGNFAQKRAIGVILTGMGNDGTSGIVTIKHKGGFCIAQDELSSIVFGMPSSAIASGSIDTVLPLEKIALALIEAVQRAINKGNHHE